MPLSKWPPGSHIGFFGFQIRFLVWPWISSPKFTSTSLVCMARSLLILSTVAFKMAAWWLYWIFWNLDCSWHGFWSITLVCFGISISISYAYCLWPWANTCWCSVMSFSKWPPGDHIRFFSFWILTSVWLWISSSNVNSNLLVYMGRSPLIFSNVTFKMATWQPYWIFQFPDSNFNLALNIKPKLHKHITCVYMMQSTHCPLLPLLLGSGTLVDHWSTISSCIFCNFCKTEVVWVV